MAAAATPLGRAAPRRRFLCWDATLVPAKGSEVICSCASPIATGAKDAAGIAFHTAILKQAGLFVYPAKEEVAAAATATSAGIDGPSATSAAAADADQPPPGVSWKGSKKKKDKKKDTGPDLYALLGLQNERWTATDKQLKDGYRKVCLEFHPDKRLQGVTDDEEKARVEDYFKQIQEAYATLSDATKRREYDSVDTFDDSLPLDCAPADFFKVFSPAFRRNARWSVDSNVPDLGDDASPWAQVDKFYNFWYTFKSWREFPHPDEEDMEGAEGREHRRYIERYNKKLREAGKKEEGRRLREFVEAAYRLDPRVATKKANDKAERERVKAEKDAGRRRAADEAEAAKAAAEAARLAAEAAEKEQRAEAKKQREAAKKAVKKERQRLRIMCEGHEGVPRLISEDDMETLIAKLEPEQLMALNEQLAVIGMPREEQMYTAMAALHGISTSEAAELAAKEQKKKEQEAAAKEQARNEHERRMASMKEWSEEELRMLDKALTKFPQGTPKRWDVVTAYIRTRTLDEVLLMVKEKQGMNSTRAKALEDFRSGMKKRAEVMAAADLRINAFTDVSVNLAGAAATVLMGAPSTTTTTTLLSQLEPLLGANTAEAQASSTGCQHTNGHAMEGAPPEPSMSAPATAAGSSQAADAAAAEANVPALTPAQNGAHTQDSTPGRKPSSVGGGTPTEKAAGATLPSEASDWSEAQELALVQALKQFGKELGTDRWEKVATLVPGKTRAQCFKRFKELRELFKAKKGAGGAGVEMEDQAGCVVAGKTLWKDGWEGEATAA